MYYESIEEYEAEIRKKAKRIIFWFCLLTFGVGKILHLILRILLKEMAGGTNGKEKRDLLVTFRTDGEIKALMRGENCMGYIAQIENHFIDPFGYDIFKGSFESYAAFLAKVRKGKLREDPNFVDKKLKLDSDGKPILVGLDKKVVRTDANGSPIDNDGNPLVGVKVFYQLTDELKQAIIKANSTTLFEEIFGTYWVGFSPYEILHYNFRWIKYGQKKSIPNGDSASKAVGMHVRDEKVNSLFFRYPQYGITIDDIEINAGSLTQRLEDGTQLNKVRFGLELVFETKTRNPQKTLFRTAAKSSAGDWLQALSRDTIDRITQWLGSITWDDLVGDKAKVDAGLREIVKEINGLDEDGLPKSGTTSAVGDYGQEVVKISIVKRDLISNLQESAERVYESENTLKITLNEAKGIKAKAAAELTGVAEGYKAISKVKGGVSMYNTNAIGSGGIRTFAPGRDFNLQQQIGDEESEKDKK